MFAAKNRISSHRSFIYLFGLGGRREDEVGKIVGGMRDDKKDGR